MGRRRVAVSNRRLLPARVDVLTAPPGRHRRGGVQLEDPRVAEVRAVRAAASEDECLVGCDGDERVAAAGGRCDAPEGHERAPSHVPVDEEGVAQGFALGAGRVRGGGGGGGVLREAPVDDVRHGRAALHRRDARGLARARMLPRGLDPPALSVGIHGQEKDLALVRARRAAPHAHRLLRPAPRILLAQGPRARAPSRGVGARRAAAPRVGLLGAHAGLDGTAGDGHAHLSRRAVRPRSLRGGPFPPRIRFDNIEDGHRWGGHHLYIYSYIVNMTMDFVWGGPYFNGHSRRLETQSLPPPKDLTNFWNSENFRNRLYRLLFFQGCASGKGRP